MHLSIDCPTSPRQAGHKWGYLKFSTNKTTPRGAGFWVTWDSAHACVYHAACLQCSCMSLNDCVKHALRELLSNHPLDTMSIEDPVLKQAMDQFKDKNFSEELCRLVAYNGGKLELVDAILREFSDDTSLKARKTWLCRSVYIYFIIMVWLHVIHDTACRFKIHPGVTRKYM